MRHALDRACTILDVEKFVGDLGRDAFSVGKGVVGLARGPYVRIWANRFCALKKYLLPDVVASTCANFLSFCLAVGHASCRCRGLRKG